MPVKTFRPLTPSTRYITIASFDEITKTKPEKSLVEIRKKTGGRNHYGRVTARGIGGGHKQKIRIVDFKRKKHGVEATVAAIEYDPIRTARLALLAIQGRREGLHHRAGRFAGGRENHERPRGGARLGKLSPAENYSRRYRDSQSRTARGQRRADCSQRRLVPRLSCRATGVTRKSACPRERFAAFTEDCYATIGQVGNTEHENVVLGKAGRSRHRGIRPINRGVSRNPVDHPNGGGAGKSKSGGGWQQLTSPWGLLAKGYRTRVKRKYSNRFIVVRRDGRPMKQR